MANKEELILDAISKLNSKVDAISSKFGTAPEGRLDNETIAVITAAVYSVFGRKANIRSVKLIK